MGDSLPEWLKNAIVLERLVENMKDTKESNLQELMLKPALIFRRHHSPHRWTMASALDKLFGFRGFGGMMGRGGLPGFGGSGCGGPGLRGGDFGNGLKPTQTPTN